MAPTPTATLLDRLAKLTQLGVVVDQAADAWLSHSMSAEPLPALQAMDEARRLLELTVDLAVSEGVAQSPALVHMRTEWEARFERLTAAVRDRQHRLSGEALLRTKQNHAALAYLRHA